MNLSRLQWTKNVKPSDGWAYSEFGVSQLFKLAWKDDEANAKRPDRDDLILLRQHGYVTHLVKVLNRQAEREDWQGNYNRSVGKQKQGIEATSHLFLYFNP
ncbi:MAG: hypothetical protein M1G31_12870 [Pseudanabaena sp. Salubria-1]|jgi:hypothetical protein|nr:hypothetical protein [Pseudanabaena sp. Salubria-1]